MCTISPYLERLSFIVASLTSGGRPAIRILLVPIPVISTPTCEISPLSCLYSHVPFVSFSISFILSSLKNLMNTRRLGQSIYIIWMPSSTSRNESWIHSRILWAEILGLRGSKMQTNVVSLSLMLTHLHNTLLNSRFSYNALCCSELLHSIKHSNAAALDRCSAQNGFEPSAIQPTANRYTKFDSCSRVVRTCVSVVVQLCCFYTVTLYSS